MKKDLDGFEYENDSFDDMVKKLETQESLTEFNKELEMFAKIDKNFLIKMLANIIYDMMNGNELTNDSIDEIIEYLKEHNIDSKFLRLVEADNE